MTQTFAILGASGGVGSSLVDQALARGHRVVALEMEWPDANSDAADRPGLTRVTADVLNDDLAPHFAGVDAVLSCLGVGNDLKTLVDPPPLYSKGTARILQGMADAGIDRLIVISASFVEAKDRGPLHFRLPTMAALHNVLDQMMEMEDILRASAVNWTAVRPGWLMEGRVTGDYTITRDVIPQDLIRTRMTDVAHFMLELAETGSWSKQTPAISRRESEAATSLSAVIKDYLG